MPKPACPDCRLFFRNVKSGITWEEGMPQGDPAVWGPYKLWKADLYECPGCAARIIVGHGQGPIAEHHHGDYEKLREIHGPVLVRIDDC